MKKNVGKTDKYIRISVGILILLLGIIFKSWWGPIGFLPLVTGIVGYCPPYSIFNINTCCCGCKEEKKEEEKIE